MSRLTCDGRHRTDACIDPAPHHTSRMMRDMNRLARNECMPLFKWPRIQPGWASAPCRSGKHAGVSLKACCGGVTSTGVPTPLGLTRTSTARIVVATPDFTGTRAQDLRHHHASTQRTHWRTSVRHVVRPDRHIRRWFTSRDPGTHPVRRGLDQSPVQSNDSLGGPGDARHGCRCQGHRRHEDTTG